jgi:hypothetical protein
MTRFLLGVVVGLVAGLLIFSTLMDCWEERG